MLRENLTEIWRRKDRRTEFLARLPGYRQSTLVKSAEKLALTLSATAQLDHGFEMEGLGKHIDQRDSLDLVTLLR